MKNDKGRGHETKLSKKIQKLYTYTADYYSTISLLTKYTLMLIYFEELKSYTNTNHNNLYIDRTI